MVDERTEEEIKYVKPALETEWFGKYMKDLESIYPNPALNQRKVELYFECFSSMGFTMWQYEWSKKHMIANRTSDRFPTAAEIIDNIKVDKDGKYYPVY